MNAIWADLVAVLGVFCGVVHSAIGERSVFGPLSREEHKGVLRHRATRDVIRAVWHLPSIAWAALGLGVLAARLAGGDFLLSAVAVVVFASSGAGNLIALRRPHFGGLILLAMAGLTAADWYLNL